MTLSAMTLLPLGAAQAEKSRYVVDPEGSRIVIHVGKEGLLSFAGHEHEVVGAFEGTVTVDPQDLGRSSVDVHVDAGGLLVTAKGEPKGDAPKVQETMTGPKCLDVIHFPTIRFVSKAVVVKRASKDNYDLEIRGDLTLHGVTRSLTVPLSVDLPGDRLTTHGRITIRQSSFNLTPITVAGVVKVKDELVLEWSVSGRRP